MFCTFAIIIVIRFLFLFLCFKTSFMFSTGKTTLSKNLSTSINATLLRSPPECISHLRSSFDALPPLVRRAYYSLGNYIIAQEIAEAAKSGPVVVDRWWTISMIIIIIMIIVWLLSNCYGGPPHTFLPPSLHAPTLTHTHLSGGNQPSHAFSTCTSEIKVPSLNILVGFLFYWLHITWLFCHWYRFWHSSAAYAIATEVGCGDSTNLPPVGHKIYQWPQDLLKPDVSLFNKWIWFVVMLHTIGDVFMSLLFNMSIIGFW